MACVQVCAACGFLVQHAQHEFDWKNVQHMIHDPNIFLQKLSTFNAEHIPHSTMERLETLVTQPHFNYDGMKSHNIAAARLATWAANVFAHNKAHRQIEAWHQRMTEAQNALEAAEVEEREVRTNEIRKKVIALKHKADAELAEHLKAPKKHQTLETLPAAQELKEAQEELKATEAEAGYLAIEIKALLSTCSAGLGVKLEGCYVAQFTDPGSKDFGWHIGDRILSVNGERVCSHDACNKAIATHRKALDSQAAKPMRLVLRRRGPLAPPLALVEVNEILPGPHGGLGLRIEDCIVTKFEMQKAQHFGWVLGDRIICVNGEEVKTKVRCNHAIASHKQALAQHGTSMRVLVVRHGPPM